MISVGIHDNLLIHKTTTNDRGTLVIGFKEGKAVNLLDVLDSVSDQSATDSRDQDFLIYGPQATDKSGEQLDTVENNVEKVKVIKDQLNHILLNYLPSDKIKWNVLEGCNITNDNLATKYRDQATLDKIYANICRQFISMMAPFINDTTKLFRVLFVRQSKAKHYPSLRKRYLGDQPFMEPMSVPKEQSRLKYTKWELENGFHSPEKVTGADVPAASEVDALFNQ